MYDYQLITDLAEKYGFGCTANEPMKNHTTFRIGGDADLFVTVYSTDQLVAVIKACNENSIPYFILGRGSNLLVDDSGMRSVVITLDGDFKNISVKENKITCGAGLTLSKLCTVALDNSLSGLEFAFGIPGSVGGAVYMNAGAYGGEMKNAVSSVTYMTQNGDVKTRTADELDFSYRHSVFKTTGDVILSAEFELCVDDKSEIKARMEDFMTRRKTKQPLEYPSAGSVFKRPEGNFAGTLIEQCGLKGTTIGGAQVSEKHAGFIVNAGDATCSDVLKLVKKIQNEVKEKTGYSLEREIIYINDQDS